MTQRIHVIDSHTGGEPTRVVLDGGPDLGRGALAERCERFRTEHDEFRSAVVNEPRGSDVLVGALLCPPEQSECIAGVIFFNNVSTLGMCGHGMMGVVATLAHLGRLDRGEHLIETPVGAVCFEYLGRGETTVRNVASYRYGNNVTIDVDGVGRVAGDVAWGGNWFFLVHQPQWELTLQRIEALTNDCWKIRRALQSQGITGKNGAEIDHIELFGPPANPTAHSKNFVLCPGGAYDRSPCGTGTSAKVACLAADKKLAPGEPWIQESITGSLFTATYQLADDDLIPTLKGSAHITAEATLLLNDDDPLRMGIRR